jgi:hypothetical protein
VGSRVRYALGFLVVTACGPAPPYGPQPAPVPDPEPTPVPAGACERAQERLTALGCPEQRTPRGASFAAACEAAAADGRNWRPDCIAQVAACSEVEAAYNTVEGQPCP